MSKEADAESPRQETEEVRLEREKHDLLSRVASSELSTIAHRVAWVLNHLI